MSGETQPTSGSRQRIDKWLFFARMVKSRSLAQSHIQSGHVRINGERCNHPSQMVKPGDRIELTLERRDVVLVMSLFCRFAADWHRPWQGEFNRCPPLISRCTIGRYKSLL